MLAAGGTALLCWQASHRKECTFMVLKFVHAYSNRLLFAFLVLYATLEQL
jgi:hypothetical protein